MATLLWQARPIRFLIMIVVLWVLLRTMIHAAAMRQEVERTMPPRWSTAANESPGLASMTGRAPVVAAMPLLPKPHGDWSAALAHRSAAPTSAAIPLPGAPTAIGNADGADRHMLRLAMLGNLVPAPQLMRSSAVAAPFGSAATWRGAPPAASLDGPLRAPGASATSALDQWSLAAWAVLRADGGASRVAAPGFGAATLGGSQAGLRLARRMDDGGQIEAFVRLTTPVRRPAGVEAALGLSWRPVQQIPVALAIEQRFAVGKDARTAPAAYAAGGVSDVGLPHGFRLDAYGQAGVVGVQRSALFADGAAAIEHRVGRIGGAPISAGAMVAAGAQPGASRVDVGPRVSLRFPAATPNSRLSLDWRARVAGDARPGSGLALTLAGDF